MTTPTLDTLLDYARAVACDLSHESYDNDAERKYLMALRDRLYVGPDQSTRVERRGTKRNLDALEGRPCSPSVFKYAAPTTTTTSSSSSGTTALALAPVGASGGVVLTNSSSASLGPAAIAAFNANNIVVSENLEVVLPNWESKPKPSASELTLENCGRFIPPPRFTSLAATLLPIRRTTILDRWSSHEMSVFESSICLYGKRFDMIATLIPNKTIKDVIEFYYHWKKTPRYLAFKKTFKAVDPGEL